MLEVQTECWTLDKEESIDMIELAECCGFSSEELNELVEYNALIPSNGVLGNRTFSVQWLLLLRTVAKLRTDFDLDIFTVAMVLENHYRIAQLEKQVQSLQALLPTHLTAIKHD